LLQSEKSIYFACFGWKQNSQDLKRNKNERKRHEGKQEKWKQSKAKIVKLRRSSLKPYWWKPKKWWSENKRETKILSELEATKLCFFCFFSIPLEAKQKIWWPGSETKHERLKWKQNSSYLTSFRIETKKIFMRNRRTLPSWPHLGDIEELLLA
jgi:hypothetical protein